jgi:hypothetical protein
MLRLGSRPTTLLCAGISQGFAREHYMRRTETRMKTFLAVFCLAGALAIPSQAAVITFEGYAPAGSALNVSPGTPYSEAGYTLTPANANSAVYDVANSNFLVGGTSSTFAFAGGNAITLTGPASFDLDSLELGPLNFAAGPIDITITGTVLGGGTLSTTFTGLTTASLQVIGFDNLTSVVFTSTDAAGIDNISLTDTPEPGGMLLLSAGLAGVAFLGRRKAQVAVKA